MFVSTARCVRYVTAQVQVPILQPTFKNSLKCVAYNTVRLANISLATCMYHGNVGTLRSRSSRSLKMRVAVHLGYFSIPMRLLAEYHGGTYLNGTLPDQRLFLRPEINEGIIFS